MNSDKVPEYKLKGFLKIDLDSRNHFVGGQGFRLGVRRTIAAVYGVKQRPIPMLGG